MQSIGVTGSSRRSYPQFTGVTASQVISDDQVKDPTFTRGKGRDKFSVERNLGGGEVSKSIRHAMAEPSIVVNLTRDSNNLVARSFSGERTSMPADQHAYL